MKKCEICIKEISTDTHHINSTSKGGLNKYSNRCELCPNCHRLVHTGKIILEGRFFTTACNPNESEVVWRNKGEKSITDLPDPEVWLYNEK